MAWRMFLVNQRCLVWALWKTDAWTDASYLFQWLRVNLSLNLKYPNKQAMWGNTSRSSSWNSLKKPQLPSTVWAVRVQVRHITTRLSEQFFFHAYIFFLTCPSWHAASSKWITCCSHVNSWPYPLHFILHVNSPLHKIPTFFDRPSKHHPLAAAV